MKNLLFLWIGLVSFISWAEGPTVAAKYSAELQAQAEKGDEDAQFQMGDCYFFGLGVKKDQREGVAWYRKAAEQGQMKAQFNLGGCFHEGLGTEPSLTEAIYWWRKAAGQDYPPAEISIGGCLCFWSRFRSGRRGGSTVVSKGGATELCGGAASARELLL